MNFSRIPFLRLVVCLSVGILLQTVCSSFDWRVVSFLLMLLFLCLSCYEKKAGKIPYFHGAFLLSATILLGMVAVDRDKKPVIDDAKLSSTLLVEVNSVPIEKPKSVQVVARVADDVPCVNQQVLFYVAKDSSSLHLREGDYLLVNTKYLRKRNDDEINEKYLKSKDIQMSCYLPKTGWQRCGKSRRFSLVRLAHEVQKNLVNVFRTYGVEGDELSVMSALTIGDKTLLDRDLKASYSVAGASHILAVSGLHVGVVYWVFVTLLSQIIRGERLRKVRSVLALLALWSYTFITGLSPSVVRASIMLSMVSFAQLVDRKSVTLNTVFASAFMMLLFRPAYLFDVGFQLSYTAVLSILLFQEKIYLVIMCKNNFIDKLWSLLSVTLAAQLGTMPLTLYYFHQFSNYFWLSGFVVIPLSSVIIYLSIGLWMMQWWTWLGGWMTEALKLVTWMMNSFVRWVETCGDAVTEGIEFKGADLLFAYLLIGGVYLFCEKSTFRRYVMVLSVLFVYLLFRSINQIFFVT